MFSLRSVDIDGPYALTYPQRRRALLSFSSGRVSDFPRLLSLPSSSSPSASPLPSSPSRYYDYPISHPSTIPPSIPPVNPDTLGLGFSFGDDSDLQGRLWALEQQDDPALLQLQYDDSDSDSEDSEDSDYNFYADFDFEFDYRYYRHITEDDNRWRSRFRRRVRKMLSFPVQFVLRKRFLWRG
ncbi:hypothetical protein GSI_05513 [Ganoderma sinense ZZ0214-1]|uniref:Uncharacterized protein n=1 Tax=Ganoderma sinense ZZ0214-1 TaxID=1077348 RepID=A0A2G8SFB0_9APHY|nr:hypothetical protein GSI_05513 [Ganoderma sinense ZZ0214-1]